MTPRKTNLASQPEYPCNAQYDLLFKRPDGTAPPYNRMKRLLRKLSTTEPEQIQKSSYAFLSLYTPDQLEAILRQHFPSWDKIVVVPWSGPLASFIKSDNDTKS